MCQLSYLEPRKTLPHWGPQVLLPISDLVRHTIAFVLHAFGFMYTRDLVNVNCRADLSFFILFKIEGAILHFNCNKENTKRARNNNEVFGPSKEPDHHSLSTGNIVSMIDYAKVAKHIVQQQAVQGQLLQLSGHLIQASVTTEKKTQGSL